MSLFVREPLDLVHVAAIGSVPEGLEVACGEYTTRS